MITRLVVLGVTGDLAGRFLLPALARLHSAGQVPSDLQVVGAGPQDLDDAAFARHVTERLQEHAGDVPEQARHELLRRVRYRRVDLDEPVSVAAAVHSSAPASGGSDSAVAVYLALPPGLFPAALAALGAAGLPTGSRVAVEKPFGYDLDSAVALNALLARTTGGVGQGSVRVDHVLAMPAVQDLLRLREPGGSLEPVWNGTAVEQIEVLWEETLALEGRADFFDRTGALKDVLQNHLLQLLALIAMELPAPPDQRDLSEAKLDALCAVRPLTPDDVATRTRRARYTSGRLAGAAGPVVPDYAQENGVDPARGTETFAELVLEVDRPRWAGTRFVLRAGKALARDRKGVLLRFREPVPVPDARLGSRPVEEVWLDLDRAERPAVPERGPTLDPARVPVAAPDGGERSAYAQVLLDLLSGRSVRSVSAAEAEQAWRIVDPVLQVWAAGTPPVLEYPAGSPGPQG